MKEQDHLTNFIIKYFSLLSKLLLIYFNLGKLSLPQLRPLRRSFTTFKQTKTAHSIHLNCHTNKFIRACNPSLCPQCTDYSSV